MVKGVMVVLLVYLEQIVIMLAVEGAEPTVDLRGLIRVVV
jgi:hypothetical protein